MRRPRKSRTFYAIYRGWIPGVWTTEVEFEDQTARYPGHHYSEFKKEAEAHAWLAQWANLSFNGDITSCYRVHSQRDHVQKASIINIIHSPSNTLYQQVVYPRLNALPALEYTMIIDLLRTLLDTGGSEVIYTTNAKIVNWLYYKTHPTSVDLNKEVRLKAFEQALQDANAWLANHPSHNPVLFWDEETWGPMPVYGVPAEGYGLH